jgi:hypothetical protein
MGGNRGWWELPEDTVAERERKYQWHEVKQVAGIKVLESKYKKNGALPRYSNTPNTMYFHLNSKDRIDQLRIFKGRNSFIDIDWGHGHGTIPRGTPHVQHWSYDSKIQTLIRVGKEHRLSPYMWRKYGQAIMQADPTINHR